MRLFYSVLLLSALLIACGGKDEGENQKQDGQDSTVTAGGAVAEPPAQMQDTLPESSPSTSSQAATPPTTPAQPEPAPVASQPATAPANLAGSKPNILLIVSDDTGVGDLGPYGGGEGRGMPTPNIDRMAAEGMTFFSFYAQPSCTPGRAAIQTGRIPNRSGMTTVAFQGQGGGLPKAEWTLASVLKKAGYETYFTGKWHLGESDYALPNAQGYDFMEHAFLYHANAYTYGDPTWFPDMDPKLRAMFDKVTKGSLSGKAGEPAKQDWKVNGQYVNTPEKGVVGLPFLDDYIEKSGIKFLEQAAKNKGTPFFININFMKNHQPNMPAPEFKHKSMSKSKYADAVVELDTRMGRVMDKLRELGLDQNTLVFYTVDNGAWQDVFPDAGYTPFRGTKGTVREGGNRVPAIAVWPGKIPANMRNHDIVGGLDLMATFASVAGIKLPVNDRAGQPIYFDSYDMSPVLAGTGKSARTSWFYFTEDELTPGAARVGNYKAVFNLRGDDGAHTGGLSVDTNLGWKGAEKYVATVPQVFDLWQDPQERYDLFMNNFTERTWTMVTISQAIEGLMKTYLQYPPRKLQSESYSGPITITEYQRFQWLRDQLEKDGVKIPMPTGN
ncbi:arylsulfatase [Microbulbifer donghaiensis]|uniref:Arylsulfatase n=1 Tax=Microbulbifer donghaiensis TaxID=494016 RepID=A0A1M4VRW2_9GAMM|nr:arylsulfatase [Microbulbifer donghaiensis]